MLKFDDSHVNLLIKFPTRSRPLKFKEQFSRCYKMLSKSITYRFIISMDTNDSTMNNNKTKYWLSEFNNGQQNVHYYYGNSKNKVQAINSDMQYYKNWDICLLMSDDMTPCQNGYDKIIYDDMIKFYPNLDGVLHYNDGRVGSKLNTLSIMGKKMYDHFGYIYHPAYTSLWCDNEFHEVTTTMGKSTYIDNCIIKHEWVNFTGKDALHCRNESFYSHDKKIFEKRKSQGFPK